MSDDYSDILNRRIKEQHEARRRNLEYKLRRARAESICNAAVAGIQIMAKQISMTALIGLNPNLYRSDETMSEEQQSAGADSFKSTPGNISPINDPIAARIDLLADLTKVWEKHREQGVTYESVKHCIIAICKECLDEQRQKTASDLANFLEQMGKK